MFWKQPLSEFAKRRLCLKTCISSAIPCGNGCMSQKLVVLSFRAKADRSRKAGREDESRNPEDACSNYAVSRRSHYVLWLRLRGVSGRHDFENCEQIHVLQQTLVEIQAAPPTRRKRFVSGHDF